MARSRKNLITRPRIVVNQGGAPEPEVTADTIVIGQQPDEKPAEKSKSKSS